MPRNFEVVHQRLQEAALGLFLEFGYDQVTTTEIATRADVTQRTFFRHFADKRDILFEREETLRAVLTDAIASAPPHLTPVQVLLNAFQIAEPMLEAQRAFVEPRYAVIAATPALSERELTKVATLTALLAMALEQRAVEPGLATLVVQASMAAMNHATKLWLTDRSCRLSVHLDRSFAQLSHLFGDIQPLDTEQPDQATPNAGKG